MFRMRYFILLSGHTFSRKEIQGGGSLQVGPPPWFYEVLGLSDRVQGFFDISRLYP